MYQGSVLHLNYIPENASLSHKGLKMTFLLK